MLFSSKIICFLQNRKNLKQLLLCFTINKMIFKPNYGAFVIILVQNIFNINLYYMKNFKLGFLLLAMVSYSCSNVDFVNDDVNSDSQLKVAESDFSLNPSTNLNGVSENSLRLSNGTQEINDQQTDESLIRGQSVRIPIFPGEDVPVEVPMGSWVTINFTLQDILNEGNCPESLTEEQINSILASSKEFIELSEFSINFNGEEIDVLSNLRSDRIRLVINGLGNCQYILPFRYYLKPQAKGDYTLTTMLEGVEYSRTISWVPGKK